jgi:hypothetical protein
MVGREDLYIVTHEFTSIRPFQPSKKPLLTVYGWDIIW